MSRHQLHLRAEDNRGRGVPGTVFAVYPVDLSSPFFTVDGTTDTVTITGTLPVPAAIWSLPVGGTSSTSVTSNQNGNVGDLTFIDHGLYAVIGQVPTASGTRITRQIVDTRETAKKEQFDDIALRKMTFDFTVDATIAGDSAIGQFKIPSTSTNYRLKWVKSGDSATNSGGWIHVKAANYIINFGASGKYKVSIDPTCTPDYSVNDFNNFAFNDGGDKEKLLTVEQWGSTQWSTMNGFAEGASNLTTTSGSDSPDLSQATDLSRMFASAVSANPDVSSWDTGSVTNMASMFSETDMAQPDTAGWDTSNVTNVSAMFREAMLANPDTSGWDTSSFTTTLNMFRDTPLASPDTSAWNTSSITNMGGMFNGAVASSPDTSGWDTSSVTSMLNMFNGAILANPDTSGWDTSSVTAMNSMFDGAVSANPDTSGWDTSNVRSFRSMFSRTVVANPDVSGWDTSRATTMAAMFSITDAATPDVSGWDTSSVTDMEGMFRGALVANPDVSSWDVSNVENMSSMFRDNLSFNGSVASFNISSLTDANLMFEGSGYSTANYDALLAAWSAQATIQSGVRLGVGDTQYSTSSQAARDVFTNAPNNWAITDGGAV